MNLMWSPHAKGLFVEILYTIRIELSTLHAAKWKLKIEKVAGQLCDFPEIGTAIPQECFHVVPDCADRLRHIVCNPYRIVYEIVDSEIHVLSIRHTRMLVTEGDTYWN